MGTALQSGYCRVLCNERDVQYNLSTIDTYQMAEAAPIEAKQLKKIAIVCDRKYLNNGKFYETVASNRGLILLMTDDMDQAREWVAAS